jgi:hypothetical protein
MRTSPTDSEIYKATMTKATAKIFFNPKLMFQGLNIPLIYTSPKLP